MAKQKDSNPSQRASERRFRRKQPNMTGHPRKKTPQNFLGWLSKKIATLAEGPRTQVIQKTDNQYWTS
jgi:hypothetical protein